MRKIVQAVSELPVFGPDETLVLDYETSGLSPGLGGRIVGIAICSTWNNADSYYVPIRHAEVVDPSQPFKTLFDDGYGTYSNLPDAPVFRWLGDLMRSPTRCWVMHNAIFELKMTWAEGIQIEGKIFDTMMAYYLLDSGLFSYALDSLTKKYAKEFKHEQYDLLSEWFRANQPKVKNGDGNLTEVRNYSWIPIGLLGPYAMEDVEATRVLWENTKEMFKNTPYVSGAPYNHGLPSWDFGSLWKNEMALLRALAEMEYRGIGFDETKACKLREEHLGHKENALHALWKISGVTFRPTEPRSFAMAIEKVSGKVLYWTLPERGKAIGNNPVKGKQKGGQYTEDKALSTGNPNFNAHAILSYMKQYRKDGNKKGLELMVAYREFMTRQQIIGSFIDNSLKNVDFWGCLHGSFMPTGTRTGRLSCRNPNLQNQSTKEGSADQKAFESFLGEKDENALNRMIRSLFVPGTNGNVLLSIDYSSLEYRLATFFSRDTALLDRYRANPTLDFHQDTADLLSIERKIAKTANFGILYGMSPRSLAELLSVMYGRPVPEEEARALRNQIFAARPALRDLIGAISMQAKTKGFIQNPCGRVVYVEPGQEYKALNYLVQGFGGDIMRMALVRCGEWIKKNAPEISMVVTVHDEIVFDMPRGLVVQCAKILANKMAEIEMVDVPLVCDSEVFEKNWRDGVSLEDWIEKTRPVQ